jgi:hypothetical protein
MAICNHCNLDMEMAYSCIGGPWTLEGREYSPVPYGQEGEFTSLGKMAPECDDCGVTLGSFHHPGCRIEACPRCKQQLRTCQCADTAGTPKTTPAGEAIRSPLNEHSR